MGKFRSFLTGIFVVTVCCLTGVGTAKGQAQNQETLKIDTTLVSVPVVVSDREGRYVSGLKASDFTLYADRVKQSIEFFADTEEPINVALLLDTSKSTTLVLDDIKKAAKDFVKQLRPQDRAMIVSFDYNETALCELTSDRKTLEKAIGKARIGEIPGTKLRDAVYDVMREEFRNVKGRKAIILLTDGKDFGSEVSERQLLDSATEADTLIYSVFYLSLPPALARKSQGDRGGWGNPRMGRRGGVFGPRFPMPPPQRPGDDQRRQRRAGQVERRNEVAIDFLEQLSEASAGRYFNSEVANLKNTFGQIVEELRHQYRLGFYPPDQPSAQSVVHSIRVEVARPDIVVRSRRSYRTSEKP
ncbi:MAG: VWA domain-containing protein [Acidobacteria bacterium]|nr:VWA domain-containing protein [Acidobacteriota bacterium]